MFYNGVKVNGLQVHACMYFGHGLSCVFRPSKGEADKFGLVTALFFHIDVGKEVIDGIIG